MKGLAPTFTIAPDQLQPPGVTAPCWSAFGLTELGAATGLLVGNKMAPADRTIVVTLTPLLATGARRRNVLARPLSQPTWDTWSVV